MLKKVLSVIVSGVLAAAAAAGCTSDHSTEKSQAAEVKRALDMRKANEDDRNGYYSRYNAFMRTCLEKAGFRWFDYIPPVQDDHRVPGVEDAEFVRVYGFGVSTLLDRPETTPRLDDNPNYSYRNSLGKEKQAKYRNVYRGCDRSSWKVVGQSPERMLQIPNDQAKLLDKADARSAADPRLAEAKHKYADCVKAHGYQASSGEELISAIEGKVAPFRAKYDAAVKRAGNKSLKIGDVLTVQELKQFHGIQKTELDMAATDHACGQLLYPVAKQVQQEWTDKALNGQL